VRDAAPDLPGDLPGELRQSARRIQARQRWLRRRWPGRLGRQCGSLCPRAVRDWGPARHQLRRLRGDGVRPDGELLQHDLGQLVRAVRHAGVRVLALTLPAARPFRTFSAVPAPWPRARRSPIMGSPQGGPP
jgi:hypothetical protein